MNKQNRRNFIKLSAACSSILGFPIASQYKKDEVYRRLEEMSSERPRVNRSVMGLKSAPIHQVKVGLIGLGNRGLSHSKQISSLYPKVKITAICDIREDKADIIADLLKESNQNPKVYSGKKDGWKQMLDRDDIDLVIIATPWINHVEMCLEAMSKGKHVAVEVPAAFSIEDCWKLVDTAEATQLNCMIMENVCYGDEELWVLNMVQNEIFGTLKYAECAYIHDLRELMFSKTYYYDQWRLRHHIVKDGNFYPTHGLGPVAQYMNIGRGDRFDHIVSMSSLEAGLSEYSQEVESDNEFYGMTDYTHGDMNSSFIKTAKGRKIIVKHDVVTPRPYNRINALAGTQAYHEGYPSRLSMNSFKNGHKWLEENEYDEMRTKYKHPIWDKLKDEIEKNGGHGGMDFVQMYRLIDCLNRGLPLDMDVYDTADWSVVVPLSKLSVELGSVPVQFPDFTRGKWKEKRDHGIMVNL